MVMRKDKCRDVIRRLVAPPAFPAVVGPWTANRTEHVSPKYPRTLALHRLGRKAVVYPRFAALTTMLLAERLRWKEPLHQLRSADAERVLKRLIRPGGKAVERNADRLDYDFTHPISRLV